MTTRYKDLAGKSYVTQWDLNPAIYRDDRYIQRTGTGDIAKNVGELSEKIDGSPGRPSGGEEDLRDPRGRPEGGSEDEPGGRPESDERLS